MNAWGGVFSCNGDLQDHFNQHTLSKCWITYANREHFVVGLSNNHSNYLLSYPLSKLSYTLKKSFEGCSSKRKKNVHRNVHIIIKSMHGTITYIYLLLTFSIPNTLILQLGHKVVIVTYQVFQILYSLISTIIIPVCMIVDMPRSLYGRNVMLICSELAIFSCWNWNILSYSIIIMYTQPINLSHSYHE